MSDPAPAAKLYVVVDAALPPGQQLAQSVHAAFQLSCMFPAAIKRWHTDSNYLVVLAAPNLDEVLHRCAPVLLMAGHVVTREPDMPGNPVTALAFTPHPDITRALSSLPLALKGMSSATALAPY